MTSNNPLISENVLEEIAFRRCAWWSNFIENLSERDDGVELDIDSMDQQFIDDHDEDDREDVEEAEEVEVNEDIDDFNVMNMTTEEKRNTIIESEEVQDVLNATRPIIEEHERKWREAGLESIMNTFDSARIENEVGGWMRRHGKNHSSTISDSESGTESSISADMQSYIRSVQKTNHKRRSKNYIQNFKRYQIHMKLSHKHWIYEGRSMYRAYDCPCCNFNSNPRKKKEDQKRELPAILTPERFSKHSRRDYNSSSDSDYSCKERLPGRTTPKKSSPTEYSKRRLESMIDNKYSTPPRSNMLNCNPTYTAPSKIRTKREAVTKALSKLSTHKRKPAKSNKISANSRTRKIDDECNETFDEDVKKAIALSLEDYERYSNRKDCLMNSDTAFSQGVNEESSSEPISCNGSNKNMNSNRGARANKIRAQYEVSSLSRSVEEAKENTFLSGVENICNSTALNSLAARKQLHSCLPSINESLEIIPSTPPEQGIERSKIRPISDMNESTIKGAPNLGKMLPKKKRVCNSTAAVTDNNSTASSSPLQEHNKAGFETPRLASQLQERRGGATEPRAKKKCNALSNRRKSLRCSSRAASATPRNCAIAPQGVEEEQKPKRMLIYTPNQKEDGLNEHFHVTKEILSNVVGEETARRFLKYNIGRLTFPKSSTVYYLPPEVDPSSSESDDDPLIKAGCYGELYESA